MGGAIICMVTYRAKFCRDLADGMNKHPKTM